MTSLLQDARYGLRVLLRRPGSAVVAVLTIALGIAATTVLFSITWNVLLKPLPWPEADRLVRVIETRQGGTRKLPPILTNGSYLAWKESAATIDEIAGWSPRTVTITLSGEPKRARVVGMTASAFRVMRARPLLGNVFADSDETADVAVIGEAMWDQEFSRRADVLGRPVHLNGQPYTIVGVMPAGFAFPDRETRVWIPFKVLPVVDRDGTSRYISLFSAIARLKPGVTPQQAAQEATARARGGVDPGMTAIAVFGTKGAVDIAVVPALNALTADVRDGILILLAAVALLLLTATANIASVQLARATTRRREMAVRAALGAGGRRLARQMLVESTIVGILGGALGLALAMALHRALPALLPTDFPRINDIALDWRIISFAFVLAIATSLAFGLLPALQARNSNLVASLAEDGNSPAGGYGRSRTARMRAAIMAAQVAVACVLLIGASLFVRSFVAMLNVDRGYDTAGILTTRLPMPDPLFAPPRRAEIVNAVLERTKARPEVMYAATTTVLPLGTSDALMGFNLPPRSGSGEPRQVQAAVRYVSADYFRALGMRIQQGRGFSDGDTQASTPVAVVNREFARRYLDDNAVGVLLPVGFNEKRRWQIAGVVEDARTRSVLDQPQPELFACQCQESGNIRTSEPVIVVRTTTDPADFTPALREIVHGIDPSVPLDSVMTMDERLLGSLARPRMYAIVLGGFAVFALAIAAVGLFGVLSYSVAQRAREIGVRTALGARPGDIVRLIVREGLIVTLVGLVSGLVAAALLTKVVATFLFGVRPHDPVTFAVVPILLVAIAAIACAVPARRAATVDPLLVLRR